MADDDQDCGHKDVMTLGPVLSENGLRPYIRHKADCTLETGVTRPLEEGESASFADGILQLEPGSHGTYDVTTLYERPRTTQAEPKGPAKVTTEAFRSGWDRVFGKSATVGQA